METSQNVSAQIYFKQLPPDPKAGQFGCSETGDLLSTCVDDFNTDIQIENAFQQQLDLSEYYKSPGVFETMKRDFMDKTMEGSNTPVLQEMDGNKPPPQIVTEKMIPSGPRDTLQNNIINPKSTFGSSSTHPKSSSSIKKKSTFGNTATFMFSWIIVIVIAILLFVYLKK